MLGSTFQVIVYIAAYITGTSFKLFYTFVITNFALISITTSFCHLTTCKGYWSLHCFQGLALIDQNTKPARIRYYPVIELPEDINPRSTQFKFSYESRHVI